MATIHLTSVEIDDQLLWEYVMGSGWETWDWWESVRYAPGCDWDRPGTVTVTCDGHGRGDEETFVSKDITVDDLARAVSVAVAKKYNGGLGAEIDWLDVESYDACAADVIMQIAVLGDCYYG